MLALPAAAPAAEVEVAIQGMQFVPAEVELRPGDTVRWRNEDIVPHTVTAKHKFDSGSIDAGKEFSFTFPKAGTFKYICRFHPTMKGEIRVKR